MKKVLVLLMAIAFIGFSCKKKENVDPGISYEEQLSLDSAAIENYFIDNGITNVLKDCTTVIVAPGNTCKGYVSYVVHVKGNGVTPIPSDSVQVSYKGRLMDTGEQFDANDYIDFRLKGLIAGWKAVLYEMQEGDSVTMYIPSGFAYGTKGTSGIPVNANLIFDMKLHKVSQ